MFVTSISKFMSSIYLSSAPSWMLAFQVLVFCPSVMYRHTRGVAYTWHIRLSYWSCDTVSYIHWISLYSACSFRSPGRPSLASWYDSMTQKMVLERPFISDNEVTSIHLLRSPGRQSIHWETKVCKSHEYVLKEMILKRTFVGDTGGPPLHIHHSGLLGDRAHWVYMIVLLRRWSWNWYLQVTLGSLCTFIQVCQETGQSLGDSSTNQ